MLEVKADDYLQGQDGVAEKGRKVIADLSKVRTSTLSC
jgi:hypothetical protein